MLVTYLIKRLLIAFAVCVTVATFLVLVVHLVPGDPARTIAQQEGGHPSPEYIAFVRHQLNLDRPVWSQVWDFLSHAARGDFGRDLTAQVPVTRSVGSALPDTILLALSGIVLAIAVGVPLGVAAARRPNSIFDRAVGGLSIVLISALPYVIGLFLLLLFAVQRHWAPTQGSGDLSHPLSYLHHLILPALSLAIPWWGYLPRFVRASMLEVMGSQYIRASRAFGVRERVVYYKYALKNALVPVVALFGLMLGYGLAGTLYAETIFNRVGLGSLALQSMNDRNWPVIRAIALLYAVFYIAGNLLSDISYRLLDPRIRVEEGAAVPT